MTFNAEGSRDVDEGALHADLAVVGGTLQNLQLLAESSFDAGKQIKVY
jgi:hypothetical protein